MRIVWRARARADMVALVTHISRDSPSGAFRVHDQIEHTVGFLTDWPDMGRKGRQLDLRELVVPRTPYLVLYRRTERDVIVLRVLHTSRNR